MTKKYAEVAPAIPLSPRASQSYTYKLPDDQSSIDQFSQVTVPFGKRFIPGVVIELHNRRTFPRLKTLKPTINSNLTPRQVKLAAWIARLMHGGLGYTLRLFQAPGPAPQNLLSTSPSINRTRAHPHAVSLIESPRQTLTYIESDQSLRYRVLADYLKRDAGKQVLIIIPEQWRASAIQAIISNRLSQSTVIFSGQLNRAAINHTWHRVHQGQPLVVIGTQKSIFLPWRQLTHIIIEEEFNPSHKLWSAYPRLDNKDAIEQLALIHQAKLITSSSILSLRQYYQARSAKNPIINPQPSSIRSRIHHLTLADRRQRRAIPTSFIESLRQWRRHHQPVLIYYNRLSRVSLLSCSKCRAPARCESCAAVITTSAAKIRSPALKCKQCAALFKSAHTCRQCQRPMRLIPTGLKKIDSLLEQLVTANIWHITAKTARQLKPGQFPKKLLDFDLIIATSAIFTIAPPHKFNHLVWLYPEQELLYPDYRSLESGRYTLARLKDLAAASRPINLVTRQPRFIKQELTSPLKPFYQTVIKERQRLHYPPVTDAVRLTIKHSKDKIAQTKADRIYQSLRDQLAEHPHPSQIQIRGPFQSLKKTAPAEYHILLTGPKNILPDFYHHLDIDRAELSPHTII